MKIRCNKKWRNIDYRYLADLTTYRGLSKQELDVAIHGVLFEGKRYPLCYVFWGDTRKYRKVRITLTGEVGTLIGEELLTLPRTNIHRGIVKISERITDLSYKIIEYV